MIFSVPTKENECTLQLDALSDNKYATISGLSLKRSFPIGIYDTLQQVKVLAYIRITFSYPNADGTLLDVLISNCSSSRILFSSNGCTDNGLEPNGAGFVNDLIKMVCLH